MPRLLLLGTTPWLWPALLLGDASAFEGKTLLPMQRGKVLLPMLLLVVALFAWKPTCFHRSVWARSLAVLLFSRRLL